MGKTRLKVLLSMLACNYNKGTEYKTGWMLLQAVCKKHSAFVITDENEKDSIESLAAKDPDISENATFFYVSLKRSKSKFIQSCRLFWQFEFDHAIRKWHQKAYALALELDKKYDFDIIHKATMNGFREPGLFWKMDKPTVWGPVIGMDYSPFGLTLKEISMPENILYLARTFGNYIDSRFKPKILNAIKNYDLVICGVYRVRDYFRKKRKNRNVVGMFQRIVEIEDQSVSINKRNPDDPFIITCSAEITPRKGIPLLIKACSGIPGEIRWELQIVGKKSGDISNVLKAIEKYGLHSRCKILGQIPISENIKKISQSHLLALFSINDTLPNVIMEAMSNGVPCVCLDIDGLKGNYPENVGFKIAPDSLDFIKKRFSEIVSDLYYDEKKRLEFAHNAIEYSRKFEINYIAGNIDRLYRKLVNGEKIEYENIN